MTTLFFILLLIPFLDEISTMFNPNKRLDAIKKFKEINERIKEIKEKVIELELELDLRNSFESSLERTNQKNEIKTLEAESKTLSKSIVSFIIKELFYMILIIIGMIMSSQWILFALLLIVSMTIPSLKRIWNNNIYKNIITMIDASICMTILFYIILNHFHGLNMIPLDLKGFLGIFGIEL
jgi:hypothetical protein